MKSFIKISLSAFLIAAILSGLSKNLETVPVYSQYGSQGKEVEAIQRVLRDWGIFDAEITGYYGPITEEAVRKVQRYNGLKETGIADKTTLSVMGITMTNAVSATQSNINLLARMISAEGRGEPYEGQVAIGAVIMNRVKHPSFPDTLAGVLYQDGAFTALVDGQFNESIASSAYSAARDAINGWDPTGGAIYYFNPAKTDNAFMHSLTVIKVIGNHRFCV